MLEVILILGTCLTVFGGGIVYSGGDNMVLIIGLVVVNFGLILLLIGDIWYRRKNVRSSKIPK